MHAEIHEALNDAAEDEGARCIVLRGEGRGFSAGADLADTPGVAAFFEKREPDFTGS